jgi:hypothetical protein
MKSHSEHPVRYEDRTFLIKSLFTLFIMLLIAFMAGFLFGRLTLKSTPVQIDLQKEAVFSNVTSNDIIADPPTSGGNNLNCKLIISPPSCASGEGVSPG